MIMHISDHGESFAEHGVIRKATPRCYEELSRKRLLGALTG